MGGYANGAPYVGLISEPTDAGIARTKLLQLQSLLQLASANGGPTVKISTADHGGTTITTISFDAGSSTPSWASSLQYAVTDQRVVIGSGDSFVARVLDMQAASSLGNSARFRAALDSVGGSSNTGAIWFDLVALRAALEPFVPADSKAVYETSIKPWVAPFDYLVAASKADGQQLNGRIAHQRRRLGCERSVERPGREHQPERLSFEPAGDERQRACRRRIAPLQIIDHQQQRRVGGEIRRQPVQAVLPRVTRIARRHGRRRPLGCTAQRAGEHVTDQRGRPRQPPGTLARVTRLPGVST